MFASNGELTPACGVPISVSWMRPASSTPASSHCHNRRSMRRSFPRFTDATGARLLTKSPGSELTETLWSDFEAFQARDLRPFPVEYLFLDAVFEPMRRTGRTREGVLAAWGIGRDGRRALLHLALGNTERSDNGLEFLRDLVKRGLRTPTTITSDGAPGLIQAIEQVWPRSLRLRCWAHKARNVLDKVPDAARAEVKAHLAQIREAASRPCSGSGTPSGPCIRAPSRVSRTI